MTKTLISVVTVVALVCCFCGVSAYASNRSGSKDSLEKLPSPIEKKQANEKLKADVTKLVADAKAGKLKMPAQHFPQPKRNNLSTGAKIGIGVAVAAVTIFVILWYTTGPGSD